MNRFFRFLKNVPANPPIFPSGHFYSPYPDLAEIEEYRTTVFDRTLRPLPGIDLNQDGQLELLEALAKRYDLLEGFFADVSKRFSFANPAYGYTDAAVLFCMLLELRPARIIEIGSGHSSSLMMDMNSRYFDCGLDLTFIEPHPALLQSLQSPEDAAEHKLIDRRLQDVDIEVFDRLGPGDLLFVDSTHISKAGSDVNRILYEILPRLQVGVNIHVHDVFYPFEYPREWIEETRAWNEDYVLRAFPQYNEAFEIVFFNHFMRLHHRESLIEKLPLCEEDVGSSIYLRKTATGRSAI